MGSTCRLRRSSKFCKDMFSLCVFDLKRESQCKFPALERLCAYEGIKTHTVAFVSFIWVVMVRKSKPAFCSWHWGVNGLLALCECLSSPSHLWSKCCIVKAVFPSGWLELADSSVLMQFLIWISAEGKSQYFWCFFHAFQLNFFWCNRTSFKF